MKKALVLLPALVLISVLSSCREDRTDDTYTAYSFAMDTNAVITVYGGDTEAADYCARLFEDLDKELSVTDSESLVYQLNEKGCVKASESLKNLITESNSISEITDKAFNVCVYPLVKLWGFTSDVKKVPSQSDIEETILQVNSSKLWVENGNAMLSENALVDFGGIAKGFASELMAESLKEKGVKAAVISLGGNIKTVGEKPNGAPWVIGINNPKESGMIGTLSIGEAAIVTSGSYLRNFTENGKLYHHIIDVKSGYPADNGLVSVTVVADNGTVADGLSTAFFVMGIEKAIVIAERLKVDAVFVTDNKIYITNGIKDKFTPDKSIEGVYTVECLERTN